MEGNLHFKINWASLIVGRKFTIFALFYFYLMAISKYKALGGLYLEGRFNRGFLRYGLIFGGAYFKNSPVFLFSALLMTNSIKKYILLGFSFEKHYEMQ